MTTKTCGNCKQADIPPPRMSKHAAPRVLKEHYGKCIYPVVRLPMVATADDYRTAIWGAYDATKCPCWEPKP